MKFETKNRFKEFLRLTIITVILIGTIFFIFHNSHQKKVTIDKCKYSVYQCGKKIGEKLFSKELFSHCSPKDFYRDGFQYKFEKELDR